MLVALVFVAEPRRRGRSVTEGVAGQQSGVVTQDMVGIGDAHGEEDCGGPAGRDGLGEDGGDLFGRRPLLDGQVLMVGELQPEVLGAQDGQRGQVLLPAHRHHVVTLLEPAGGIPGGDLVGVGRRSAGQDGDHRGGRVTEEQVPRTHDRIVEVRGDHRDPLQHLGPEQAPHLSLIHALMVVLAPPQPRGEILSSLAAR